MNAMIVTGIAVLIAVIAGIVLGYLIARGRIVGQFTINYTDPAKDLVRLTLDKDLDTIDRHRLIALRVKVIGELEE